MVSYSFSGTPVFVTVGAGGTYTITAYGAQGGFGGTGGVGAEVAMRLAAACGWSGAENTFGF